jgi:hypothetical protein
MSKFKVMQNKNNCATGRLIRATFNKDNKNNKNNTNSKNNRNKQEQLQYVTTNRNKKNTKHPGALRRRSS